MWRTKQLTTTTKTRVYEACVLSILLYGAEGWLTQESSLDSMHFTQNPAIPFRHITWKDGMSNEELFYLSQSGPLSSKLKFTRLRCAGHVNGMPKERFPHAIHHSVWNEGSRRIGRPWLWYKEVLKKDPKDIWIDPGSWAQLSQSSYACGLAFTAERIKINLPMQKNWRDVIDRFLIFMNFSELSVTTGACLYCTDMYIHTQCD